MKNFLRFVLIAASLMLFSCAGYQLGGAKPSNYSGIDSIAVPQFENQTLEPRLSSLMTNSTVDALAQDGTYRVGRLGNADATLLATIRSIEYQQYRANRFDTLASDELLAYIYVDWQVVKNGQTIGQGKVKGTTNFFVGDNLQISRKNALPTAAARAAQQIVTHLAEGF